MSRLWLFADGSQAEARVVAWEGPVPLLKTWFKSGEDVHTNVARLIACAVQENGIPMPGTLFTSKPWREYDHEDEERQIAKVTVHANNYKMGPEQFAFVTKVPERYAAQVQDIYFHLFPEIRDNYQANINAKLAHNRTLVNPYGRTRIFYGRIDDKTKREAYAWTASSVVGDWLSSWFTDICEAGWDMLLQLHDAGGVSVGPVNDAWLPIIEISHLSAREGDLDGLARAVKTLAERPIIVGGEPLVIPVDFKVGPSWGEAKNWRLDGS